jgi:hypothetical protein
MRNVAMFAGGSVTMGLGLELELRPKYNDHEWLSENGLILPLPREKEDEEYWKTYRYSKLVSDSLNLIEYNIHDHYNTQIGGDAISTIWLLSKFNNEFSELLNNVKYIFFDIGFIRWWDENLHGYDNKKKLPNTVNEVIEFIKNPNNDRIDTEKALNWLINLDINRYWEETIKKYNDLKNKNPEIHFIVTPWVFDDQDVLMTKRFDYELKDDLIFFGEEKSMYNFLVKNKLMVGDVAMGFNGKYKYTHKDMHPSSVGHKKISEIIIEKINQKNEN